MDDADAGRFGVARAGEADRLAGQQQLAVVVGDHAGQNLHQRAFAGAVLAADRVQLARQHVERDVRQREHAGKALGDAVDRDDGLLRGHGRSSAPGLPLQLDELDRTQCHQRRPRPTARPNTIVRPFSSSTLALPIMAKQARGNGQRRNRRPAAQRRERTRRRSEAAGGAALNVTASTTTMPTIMPFVNVGARLDELGDGVDHHPQKQRAQHGAGDRADAALQAAAADDRRGNRVQLVAAGQIHRLGDAAIGHGKNAGDRRGHAAEAIGEPLHVVGANARKAGRLLVAAQGIDVPAEDRAAEDEPRRRRRGSANMPVESQTLYRLIHRKNGVLTLICCADVAPASWPSRTRTSPGRSCAGRRAWPAWRQTAAGGST